MNLKHLLPFLLFGLGIAACNKEPEPQPEPEPEVQEKMIFTGKSSFDVPSIENQQATISFSTNCAWSVYQSEEDTWLTLDKQSGGEPSSSLYSYNIHVTASSNTTGNERYASIVLHYGTKGNMKVIQFTQPSLKHGTVSKVTDDMIFSSCCAGTITSVQQGFCYDKTNDMLYFTQVTGGYKNTVSWRKRVQITKSTEVASTKMWLYYFSHADNFHIQTGIDGSKYLWVANYGTRDSEGKYTNPQILSKVKIVNGATVKNTETTENYYFGTRTLRAFFDEKNDMLAVYSNHSTDGYCMTIYKLSEVLATPVSEIKLKYSITYGGTVGEIKAPDAEWSGYPTVQAHDCRSLTPLYKFNYNYTSNRSWQTYTIYDNKVYFFLANKKKTTSYAYQSVIDVVDLSGKSIKQGIFQPFSDDIETLETYTFTDKSTAYMENEGIQFYDGVMYLLYTAKNSEGTRRPVIFNLLPPKL